MTDWTQATLEEIESAGQADGERIAKELEVDPVDEGHEELLELSNFKEHVMEQLCDAEETSRTYTPFEFFAKELNERPDADEAWDAYDEGISIAFSNAVDEWDDKQIPITEEMGARLTINTLNELYPVEIHGKSYDAGIILQQCDPDRFDQIMLDNVESMGYTIV